jgi:hypothetical protein
LDREPNTSPNTAYTLRDYDRALREIAPFGRNVVHAGNVRRNNNLKHGGEDKNEGLFTFLI